MRRVCLSICQRLAMVKGKAPDNAIQYQEEQIAKYFNIEVQAKDKKSYGAQFVEKYMKFLSTNDQIGEYRSQNSQNFIEANQRLKIGQFTQLQIAKYYKQITPQAQSAIDNFAKLCINAIRYNQFEGGGRKSKKPTKNVVQLYSIVNNLFLLMSESVDLYLQYLQSISLCKISSEGLISESLVNYRVCMEALKNFPPTAFTQQKVVRIIRSMNFVNIHYMFHQRSSQMLMHFYKLLDPAWHTNPRLRRIIVSCLSQLECFSQDINKKFRLILLDQYCEKRIKLFAFNALIKYGYINSSNCNTTEKKIFTDLFQLFKKEETQFFFRQVFIAIYRADIWIPQFWVPFFKNMQANNNYEIDIYHFNLLKRILQVNKQAIPLQIIEASQVLQKVLQISDRQNMMKNYIEKQVNNKNLTCQVQIANSLRLTNIGSVRTQVLVDIFMVDILINNKFVVEVNGSTHYMTNIETGQKLYTLKTLFRTKFLKKLGYSVIDIALQNFNEGSFEIIREVYNIVNDPKNQNEPKSYLF